MSTPWKILHDWTSPAWEWSIGFGVYQTPFVIVWSLFIGLPIAGFVWLIDKLLQGIAPETQASEYVHSHFWAIVAVLLGCFSLYQLCRMAFEGLAEPTFSQSKKSEHND